MSRNYRKFFPLIPVVFFSFISACYTRQESAKVTFPTPFGEIEKASSMGEVMSVLGNPCRILSHDSGETWYYFFEQDKRLSVYFLNGKVIDISEYPG